MLAIRLARRVGARLAAYVMSEVGALAEVAARLPRLGVTALLALQDVHAGRLPR